MIFSPEDLLKIVLAIIAASIVSGVGCLGAGVTIGSRQARQQWTAKLIHNPRILKLHD
jgi:uncharacterized membrane protein YhiD involved in acid resistance